MKKFWIQLSLLLVVIFAAFYVTYNPTLLSGIIPISTTSSSVNQVKIAETVVDVEVADTPNARAKGLSGRERLDDNQGMLFIFDTPKKYQFWMKGMSFPLDMIFIQDGRVVDIIRSAPVSLPGGSDLPIYEPIVPINMMLEVKAGFADAHGIKVGDTVFQISQ